MARLRSAAPPRAYFRRERREEDEREERRKGPDRLLRSLTWLALIGWGLLLLALILIDEAKPPMEDFFSRSFNITLRKHWDYEILDYLFYVMLGGLAVSGAGLYINRLRHRRRDDRYRRSLIALFAMSAIGVIYYVMVIAFRAPPS